MNEKGKKGEKSLLAIMYFIFIIYRVVCCDAKKIAFVSPCSKNLISNLSQILCRDYNIWLKSR